MLPYYVQMSRPVAVVRAPPPDKAAGGPPRRRPHEPATLDRMRELFEATTLPTRAIAARTGASAATVSRRARRGGWLRPDAGPSEDNYSPEGRRKLRRGAIAETLLRQAERLLFERQMNPAAGPAALARALRLVRAAKRLDEDERPKKRGRKRRKVSTSCENRQRRS